MRILVCKRREFWIVLAPPSGIAQLYKLYSMHHNPEPFWLPSVVQVYLVLGTWYKRHLVCLACIPQSTVPSHRTRHFGVTQADPGTAGSQQRLADAQQRIRANARCLLSRSSRTSRPTTPVLRDVDYPSGCHPITRSTKAVQARQVKGGGGLLLSRTGERRLTMPTPTTTLAMMPTTTAMTNPLAIYWLVWETQSSPALTQALTLSVTEYHASTPSTPLTPS
jgi:hypothetical protein